MSFWDSSALVPLLIEESTTEEAIAIYRSEERIFVWWSTPVECASAVARLERQDDLEPSAATEAFGRLRGFLDDWSVVEPGEAVRELALRLLRAHALTAADALQLAAATVTSENRPHSLELVTADTRLATAAEREGFRLRRLAQKGS